MISTALAKATKATGDIGASGITVAAILEWMPEAAGVLAVLWWLLRFYELEIAKDFCRKIARMCRRNRHER